MDKMKWTERKWAKRAGWAALLLWTVGCAIYVFGRNLLPVVAGLGTFYLLGGLVIALIWLVYKLGGRKKKRLPDLGEIGVVVMTAVAAGLLVTLAQERLIKFPHRFSDPLLFSNVVIVAVFFLLGRASKKGREEDGDD